MLPPRKRHKMLLRRVKATMASLRPLSMRSTLDEKISMKTGANLGVASLIAATSIVGGAVGLSVPAKASPLSFVQSLNNHGIAVYDTATALRTGYAICGTLDTHNGADVAEAVYRLFADVPTRQIAYAWVESSVEELCPWQDHRKGIAA